MFTKLKKWWLFHMANPVERMGEKGGFKWVFRKYTLEISTLSDNFNVRFTAAPHPYGYLWVGDSEQTQGFASRLYEIAMLMTTDQGFVDDLDKALQKYQKRLDKLAAAEVKDDETEESIALEEVKALQEVVEMGKKERRKYERDVNGRFKKAVARNLQEQEEK